MGILTGQGDFLSNCHTVGKVSLLMYRDLVAVVQLAEFTEAVSITLFVDCLNGLFLSTPTGGLFEGRFAPNRWIWEDKTDTPLLIDYLLCHHDCRNERRPQVCAFGSAFGAEAL